MMKREEVRKAVERSKDLAAVAVGAGSTLLGEQLLRRTEAARTVSAECYAHGQPQIGRGVAEMSDAVERVATYLRSSSGEQIMHDAQRLGREKPWLVAGAGLLGGLVLSRTLRASIQRNA